jgi:hypothetical protein
MRAIEKFTRTGNQILYEVTIEDPVVLVQPWVMPAADPEAGERGHDCCGTGKLHGGRAQRSQHPDAH